MEDLTAKEAHIKQIEHQIVYSRQLMNEALDRGDMRRAEQALDQLTSYRKLLEAAQ